MGDLSTPDPPLGIPQSNHDDFQLSVPASPQVSFETKGTQFNVTYSWSGGIPTLASKNKSEPEESCEEIGQEVTAVTAHNSHARRQTQRTNCEIMPACELVIHETTPRASGTSSLSSNMDNSKNMCKTTPKRHNRSLSYKHSEFGTNNRKASGVNTFIRNSNIRAATAKSPTSTTRNTIDEKQVNRSKGYIAKIVNSSNRKKADDEHLATPSWDIHQTFSFRKNNKETGKKTSLQKQTQSQGVAESHSHRTPHHNLQHSQSSFSMIWDIVSLSVGLSRSESMSAAVSFAEEASEGQGEESATVPQRESCNERGEEVNESPGLSESMENDLFAQEVGLML